MLTHGQPGTVGTESHQDIRAIVLNQHKLALARACTTTFERH